VNNQPQSASSGDAPFKAKRIRSPNYPAVNLETAIRRVQELYSGAGRHPVGVETVAKLWGQSPKSSAFKVLLAAIRAFGLVDDFPGGGKEQLVKLSGQGLDIVTDYPVGSPQRQKAIENAALRPKLHAELWKRYGGALPVDDEIRRHLVRDRGFHDKTVGDFIAEYKGTLSFAKITDSSTIMDEPPASDRKAGASEKVNIGDYVQWTNAGVDSFAEPRLVRGFSEDGQWAFVEGGETGVLASELTVMNPQTDSSQMPTPSQAPKQPLTSPPVNPFHKKGSGDAPIPPPVRQGSVQEQKVLDEGTATMQWPDDLSPESVADFEYWVNGILRRLRRKAGLPLESD
jgi:hypothetical protein